MPQFVNVIIILGPCAGKTTTVARLRTFFENLGWKVRMPLSVYSEWSLSEGRLRLPWLHVLNNMALSFRRRKHLFLVDMLSLCLQVYTVPESATILLGYVYICRIP